MTDKNYNYCYVDTSEFGCAYCYDNPNCYYKQSKRKEQECERLKAINTELAKYLMEIFELLCIDTGQSLFGSNCIEFYAIRSSTAENKIKQYKQALDEIEEIVKSLSDECFYNNIDDCQNCDMNNGCSVVNLHIIKDRINKAKEG